MKIKILLLLPLVFFSCKLKTDDKLSGNKNIVKAIIDVESFNSVKIEIDKYLYNANSSNTANIKIFKSETNRVVISTDENILQNLNIRNSYNYLEITSNNIYDQLIFSTLNIEIYTNNIENISNYLISSKVEVSGFEVLNSLNYTTYNQSELILPEEMNITNGFSIFNFKESNIIITISGLKHLITGNLENSQGTQLYFPDLEKITANNHINITLNMIDQQNNLSLFGDNINLISDSTNELSISQIKANNYLSLTKGVFRIDKIISTALNISDPYKYTIKSIDSSEVTIASTWQGSSINSIDPSTSIGIIKADNLTLKHVAGNISLPVLENIKLLDISQNYSDLVLMGNVHKIKLDIKYTDFYNTMSKTEFNGTDLTCNIAEITQEKNCVVKLNIKDELTYNLKSNSELIYSGVKEPTTVSTKHETATVTYLGDIK